MGPSRQPSRAWVFGALLAFLTSVGVLGGSVAYQRSASKPVGEGDLFLSDATWARERINGTASSPDEAVRAIRNRLEVEAVSLLDADGTAIASTSGSEIGMTLESRILRFALGNGFFAAVASPVPRPLEIDNVVEWQVGDVLYHVIQPLNDSRALLLQYDISALLTRRAANQGIRPLTVQLMGLSGFFLLAGIGLLLARMMVKRRIYDLDREADALRERSAELEEHNRQITAARSAAEKALALAEEKNRIRAEFVLMINHELRTPLTSLVTGAEVLREELVSNEAERSQLLSHMVADGRRLQEMIAQMLAVARVENRGLAYTLVETEIDDALRSLEDKCPRLVHRREHSIDPEHVTARTDPMTLTQLIASLADNALTHGADRVELVWRRSLPFRPMLEVGARPLDPLFLLVIDNGPGIELDFLPRAFEKFEKHGSGSGTGLGLYIARMMTEALGGSLSVHTSDHGTTMAVAIPLVRSDSAESAA